MSDNPRLGLTLLVDTGLCEYIFPELPGMRLTTDEHLQHKDVYEHSLTVLDQAVMMETMHEPISGPDPVLRLSALFHDIGKPRTRKFDDGRVSFHHHEVVGARLAKKRLQELRFDGHTVEAVETLIALHLRFHGYGDGDWSDSAVRRYVRDAGELLTHLHVLTRADCTTRNKAKAARLAATYESLEARIAVLMEQEELSKIRPDLDGAQVMEILNLKPSRAVGQAMDFLMELRLERGQLGVEIATQELLKWWNSK
jgi:poly(A) polymerase